MPLELPPHTHLITCRSGTRFFLGRYDDGFAEFILMPGRDKPLIVPLDRGQYEVLLSAAAQRAGEASTLPVEHEAKFLLNSVPELREARASNIRQSYLALADDGAELRIRDKDEAYTQTVKLRRAVDGKPSAEAGNFEAEIKLSEAQYAVLAGCPALGTIEKTRHLLPWGAPAGELKLILELDEYKGPFAGLWVLEVEADVPAIAEFRRRKPDWVGQEVTEDLRFKNRNILNDGIPSGTRLHK